MVNVNLNGFMIYTNTYVVFKSSANGRRPTRCDTTENSTLKQTTSSSSNPIRGCLARCCLALFLLVKPQQQHQYKEPYCISISSAVQHRSTQWFWVVRSDLATRLHFSDRSSALRNTRGTPYVSYAVLRTIPYVGGAVFLFLAVLFH